MKKNCFAVCGLGIVLSTQLFGAGEGNFQISAPPIAAPVFEEGKEDFRFEPIFASISSSQMDIDLAGAGLNLIGRQGFSDFFALDLQGQMFVLSGQMPGAPGMLSFTDAMTFYTVADDKADVTMASMNFSVNGEFLVINEASASMILFGGLNFGFSNMIMQTPYSIVRYSNGLRTTGYTSETTVTSTTAGVQFGLQTNFVISNGFSITPFAMMSSASGTANIEMNSGNSSGGTMTTTGDIPTYTTTSYGMDIIIDTMSIGTLLQTVSQEDESDLEIYMIKFGWLF